MDKKNDALNQEQEKLIKQDREMWATALVAQDYKVDDPRWEDIWIEFYKWDRIKIRFMDPKDEKFLQIKKKMELLRDGAWEKTTDPNLIAFRNAMEKHFPNEVNDHMANLIWMHDEYNKWTFRAKRLFDLTPPFVKKTIRIPKNICALYTETRECYISGHFRAAIALSRSVVECCIKDKWKKMDDKKWGAGTALHHELKLGTTHDLNSLADDIILWANDILHKASSANEKNALKCIDKTKSFIEKFYEKQTGKK